MTGELIFLQDMAVVMAISGIIAVLCHRFKLPVVVGYIFAGFVIGPNTPPYSLVNDLHSIHTLAEMGMIFLLFSIGLEFSFSRLVRVGVVAFFAATVEIALMLTIGYSVGKAFGWSAMNSLFLGAILSISSTTIIAKILLDTRRIKEKFSQVILGILIIEDLLAIIIIAVLSGIAATGSLEWGKAGIAMMTVTGFVMGVLFFGFLLVPRLLRYIDRFDSAEMTIITVLGLCFGVSLLAAKAGFSVALGAFLIGAIIAEARQAKNVIHKMESIRDMFTAIFFVSVGMLLSPQVVHQYAWPILVITGVTIVGKVFSCSAATFLTGHSPQTALKVGLGLAQIGEFSFIIAMLGESTGVTSPFLYPIAVSVSGITALTTPLLMRNDASIEQMLTRVIPKPLVTISALYTGWLEEIKRGDPAKSTVFGKLKPHLPYLLLHAFAVVSVTYACGHFKREAAFLPDGLYWIASVMIVLPFLLELAHRLDRFLWELLSVRAEHVSSKEIDMTLQKAVRFLVSTAIGALFFAGAIAHWPLWPLAVVVAALMVISGAPFWDSINRVHAGIEKTVIQVFDQEKPAESAGDETVRNELVRLIQDKYPLSVATEDFILPFQESAVNRPIRDLGLRFHTGASIMAVYRGGESIPNPPPETVLMPGDVLMLMGKQDQIRSAIKYLQEKTREPNQRP